MALVALREDESVDVVGLVTTAIEEASQVQVHGTPLKLIEAQADALSLPLHVMEVPPEPTNATYEERLERTVAPLLADGVEVIAAGDLHLDDVRAYRADLIRRLGAEPLFPIWGRPTTDLARDFLDRGFQAVVTSVDTTQVDADLAGRSYDAAFLDALPGDADPCGEHGEFHTFVTHGPIFNRPVPATVTRTHGTGRMRYAGFV
jgi:uncharacterized protein (TIGR00290 family)